MLWKFSLGFIVFLALVAVGLAFYGASLEPERSTVERVLPDGQFPR